MRRTILLLCVCAGYAFAQCGANGTLVPNFATGQLECTGKVGAAGYTAPFSSVTGLTVTAATHGQGVKPVGFCYDNATPANLIAQTANFPTVAANGDMVFAWSGSKTGYCVISALGNQVGPTGQTGATGPTGATGASGLLSGTLASIPATCTTGASLYQAIDQAVTLQLYACTATNTWTRVSYTQGVVASIPATCTTGQVYFATDATAGANLYLCTSVNTWTQVSGGGGGGGSWSSLTNPTGNLSLSMGTHTTQFSTSSPSNGTAFTFQDNTGQGTTARFTSSSLTNFPTVWQADNNSTGWRIGLGNNIDPGTLMNLNGPGEHIYWYTGYAAGSPVTPPAGNWIDFHLQSHSLGDTGSYDWVWPTAQGQFHQPMVAPSVNDEAYYWGTALDSSFLLTCSNTTVNGTSQSCQLPYAGSTSLSPGLAFTYVSNTANTGSLQVTVDSNGPYTVKKWLGSANLVAGDIPANVPVPMWFDGTNMEIGTIGNAPSGGTASYAYHAYSGTSMAVDFSTYNSVQLTTTGAGPTVTVSNNPTSAGAPVHINICNDGTANRAWTLPATFKLIGVPILASECVATDANWDGTNYNGLGTNATPSILEFAATRAAPTQSQCTGGGCAWIDSTDVDLEWFVNGGAGTYAMLLKGVDVNPVTGQVTGSHLSAALPINQGGSGTASTLTGIMRGGNPFTASELSGDVTTSGSNVATVKGVNSVPLCTGFSPSNGQFLQYTTGGAPNPCYSAAAGGGTVDAASVKGAIYCTDSSVSANTITCAPSVTYPTYATGLSVIVKLANTVTGATTIAVGGQASKSVTKNGTTAIANNDMLAGGVYLMTYDGTEFVVYIGSGGGGSGTVTTTGSPSSGQMSAFSGATSITTATGHNMVSPTACPDSSGSGTVQVCNTSPTFTPASGDQIVYSTTTTNTGDVTVNVNSLGAKHIRKWSGAATLASGDLVANTPVTLTYDGTYWEIPTIGNAPAGSGTVTTSGSPASGQISKFSGASSITTATGHDITGALVCAAASASGTAYTCSTSPTFTPASGDAILFKADVASGAAPTLAVNSASAATLVRAGQSLVANSLLAGYYYRATFDGTNWQVDGPSGNPVPYYLCATMGSSYNQTTNSYLGCNGTGTQASAGDTRDMFVFPTSGTIVGLYMRYSVRGTLATGGQTSSVTLYKNGSSCNLTITSIVFNASTLTEAHDASHTCTVSAGDYGQLFFSTGAYGATSPTSVDMIFSVAIVP